MIPVFRVKFMHGREEYEDPEMRQEYIKSLKHDWWHEEVIRPIRKKRSDRQNRYYFGVVVKMIAKELGDPDHNGVHDDLANKFLEHEEREVGGVIFHKRVSTTSLSTEEFGEYVETVKRWAASFLNLTIPDPDQVDFL